MFLENILIVQVYVGDIIFRATDMSLYKHFSKLIQREFHSMMGDLNLILELQIKQTKEG